ncbi:nucleoside hydrolase [Gordonia sp. CPCC 205515]|uniref:nucleoside hydrolase n=1 Tax=Gordonia sp. CPCC 205515 TaxID=3140791 RepID=UPI003AF3E0F7
MFRGPVHVDTDCGVDDALALAVLGQVANVASVTTTWGNCSAAQAAANARYVLRRTGALGVPVVASTDAPPESWTPSAVHGPDGMGGVLSLHPEFRSGESDAAAAIVSFAREAGPKGRLLAIAPLSNLAQAYCIDPAALAALDRIVVMAGHGLAARSAWLDDAGDTNTRHNPTATACIAAAESLPVTWVGLDVTRWVVLGEPDFGASPLGAELAELSAAYGAARADAYGYEPSGAGWRVPAHDTVASTALLIDDSFETCAAAAFVDKSSGTPVVRGSTSAATRHLFATSPPAPEMVGKLVREALRR